MAETGGGLLADLFHSFPHVDFNFYNTTLIFTPDNTQYQQALLFNGIYLLFATLIIFLILAIYFLVCSCYFCTNCAHHILKPRPSRSRCLRSLVGLLAVCSSVALGVGYYGNNKTEDGVNDVSSSILNIYNRFDLFRFKDVVIERYIEVSSMEYLKKLEYAIFHQYGNQSEFIETLKNNILSMTVHMKASGNLLKDADVDLKTWTQQCQQYDQYRWWLLLGVLCWHLLLILIIFYSAYSERRCPFVVLTIMSVLSFFFMGCSVSLETPMSIGAADLCINPKAAILQYLHKPSSKALVKYYLDCEENMIHTQLVQSYHDTEVLLDKSLVVVKELENLSYILQLNGSKVLLDGMKDTLTSSKSNINELISILSCNYINTEYNKAIESVCTTVLDGLGLSILACLLMILFLAATLLCITPIWRAIAPLRPILRRDKYGVHFITESYQGPPGGSESFNGSTSSFDASYKSIEEDFEHVPLINNRRDRPPSYRAIHGSTEFLSVEEDDKRGREHTM